MATQSRLHVEATHSRHVQVEHDAVRHAIAQARQKCCATTECRDLKLRRSQEALKRLADGWLVVNDSDEASRLAHDSNPNAKLRRAISDFGPTGMKVLA